VGTSPISATALTGFALTLDSSNEFSTSSLVTGRIFAADFAPPTPTKMTTAISDMETAYGDAAGRILPDEVELGLGNIEGMTLTPGLYKWSSSVSFMESLTFDGTDAPDATWILQIAGDIAVGSAAQVILKGGAKAENIVWQFAGSAQFGTTSHVEGVFLGATRMVFQAGSSLNGKALSQTAVTLDAATIVTKV